MVDTSIMKRGQDWELQNPEMVPVPVPAGYNARYLYQLSAVCRGEVTADYRDMGGWGIVSLETDHVLTEQEMDEYKACLENEGAVCMNDLRLVRQTFTCRA